jgi:hypothetical protein
VLLEEVPPSPLRAKVAALKEKVATLLGKGTKSDAKTPTTKPPEDQIQSTESASPADSSESMNGGPRLRNTKI